MNSALIAVALLFFVGAVYSKPGYYHKYIPRPTRPPKDCKGFAYRDTKFCYNLYYYNRYKYGQYHVYDADCTCFIQCNWWVTYVMPCAPGTRWSQTLKTCVHGTACKPVKPPVKVIVDYYERKPTDCIGYSSYDKFCLSQPNYGYYYNNFYHEYPRDCSCFYQCDKSGRTFIKPCARGTVWSQSDKTCVRPCPGTCGSRPNPVYINSKSCPPKKHYGDAVDMEQGDIADDGQQESEE